MLLRIRFVDTVCCEISDALFVVIIKVDEHLFLDFVFQNGPDYRSEESRRIHCTKCGNSHIWVCTNRSKAKARWCQVS